MYSINLNPSVSAQKFIVAGIKLLEFCKLSLQPGAYKNSNNKESLLYILNSIPKNVTVIDIGNQRRDYLLDMMKLSGHSEKLITFQPRQEVYNYLVKMKQLLRLKNVVIEDFLFAEIPVTPTHLVSSWKNKRTSGATVIDIKEPVRRVSTAAFGTDSLDYYFFSNDIKPDVLKLKFSGSELELLKGAKQTLEMYKPTILLECAETQKNRDNLLATFEFLTNLEYDGYFILDTLKIPLSSFDFNIYQNETYGFYCNNFLFE